MVKRCFKGIFNYIKKADILLWLLLAAISAYSLLLLRSVDSAVGTGYFRTQLFRHRPGRCGGRGHLLDGLWGPGELLVPLRGRLHLFDDLHGPVRRPGAGQRRRERPGVDPDWRQHLPDLGGGEIAFILTFSKHLDTLRKKELLHRPLHVVLLAFHALIPMLLCQLQGDTGAAVVFFAMFVVMSLAAGVKLRYFAMLGGLILVTLPLLWKFFMSEYQKLRFIAVFNLGRPQHPNGRGLPAVPGEDLHREAGSLSGQGLFNGSRVAAAACPSSRATTSSPWPARIGLCRLLPHHPPAAVVHAQGPARGPPGPGRLGQVHVLWVFRDHRPAVCVQHRHVPGAAPCHGRDAALLQRRRLLGHLHVLGFGLVQSVHMRRKEGEGLRLNRKAPIRFITNRMENGGVNSPRMRPPADRGPSFCPTAQLSAGRIDFPPATVYNGVQKAKRERSAPP